MRRPGHGLSNRSWDEAGETRRPPRPSRGRAGGSARRGQLLPGLVVRRAGGPRRRRNAAVIGRDPAGDAIDHPLGYRADRQHHRTARRPPAPPPPRGRRSRRDRRDRGSSRAPRSASAKARLATGAWRTMPAAQQARRRAASTAAVACSDNRAAIGRRSGIEMQLARARAARSRWPTARAAGRGRAAGSTRTARAAAGCRPPAWRPRNALADAERDGQAPARPAPRPDRSMHDRARRTPGSGRQRHKLATDSGVFSR